MHKLLRYRFTNGLELPVDEDGARNMMATDFDKALSSAEIRNIRKAQMKAQKKKFRN